MVFYGLKIRSKTANVAEEKLKEVSRHFGSLPREKCDLGTFIVPSQKWTPRLDLESPSFNFK
ncbi:hypothetical protein E2C01_073356 [Portunus trituberculatus]|uniref:Uncharacterized protein n=1 Tax=Portunus trituberculatus TaxID=210409 RepID=A0A5B7IDR4_PORTR|nr:hypothetical protein [Portunus trituberculatus]